jgi:hypothetical protein
MYSWNVVSAIGNKYLLAVRTLAARGRAASSSRKSTSLKGRPNGCEPEENPTPKKTEKEEKKSIWWKVGEEDRA